MSRWYRVFGRSEQQPTPARLLEHLRERDEVLQKLVRALRPGGWLVIEDTDYISGVPVSDLGANLHEHTQAVRLQAFASAGVEHTLGRQLPAGEIDQ